MPTLKHKLPSYCRHKGTGQAVVHIEGRDRYLGTYGSPKRKARYEAEIARWMATKGSPVLQAFYPSFGSMPDTPSGALDSLDCRFL